MSTLSTANKCLIANNLFMGRINYIGSWFEHEKKFLDLNKVWLRPVVPTNKTMFLFQMSQKAVHYPVTRQTDAGPVRLMA